MPSRSGRRWPFAFSGGMACLCLTLASVAQSSQGASGVGASNPLPQVIKNGPRNEKRIAITFDACSFIHASKLDRKLVQILVDKHVPDGEYYNTLVSVAASLGLTIVQFDLASCDPYKRITAARLSRWVIEKARSGSIIVMHINTHGWHTAEAMPTIIETLRRRDYQFVTVSELLNQPFPSPPGMVLALNGAAARAGQ